MASVASQLIEEVTAHAQSDSLEDVREICADGTYFQNNLRSYGLRETPWNKQIQILKYREKFQISFETLQESCFGNWKYWSNLFGLQSAPLFCVGQESFAL